MNSSGLLMSSWRWESKDECWAIFRAFSQLRQPSWSSTLFPLQPTDFYRRDSLSIVNPEIFEALHFLSTPSTWQRSIVFGRRHPESIWSSACESRSCRSRCLLSKSRLQDWYSNTFECSDQELCKGDWSAMESQWSSRNVVFDGFIDTNVWTDPVSEIEDVILRLTRGSPRTQEHTIRHYFLPNASFKHPFCSVSGNREAILRIFQWYKILSPHIDITINSVGTYETCKPLRKRAWRARISGWH